MFSRKSDRSSLQSRETPFDKRLSTDPTIRLYLRVCVCVYALRACIYVLSARFRCPFFHVTFARARKRSSKEHK